MSHSSRRAFLTAATSLVIFGAARKRVPNTEKKILVHHVFFWLKNPASKEDLAKLAEGVRSLNKIEAIRMIHVGFPADTEKRSVVDASYSVSELIFFDDVSGQNTYQNHPIHKKFVENYSSLWEKVIVYDSMDI